ncbi:DUF2188 domain-containing protein [Cupriavidus sp. M-11]|uniref:DUF2188 domain-containing protein n=1 Tax=Cupriavidus sp. M-11 TaxID=3233038 RepID=UPI003F914E74
METATVKQKYAYRATPRWSACGPRRGASGSFAARQPGGAIESGTAEAKRDNVELLVHGRDGQIRMLYSYGHDPRNVKGYLVLRDCLRPLAR